MVTPGFYCKFVYLSECANGKHQAVSLMFITYRVVFYSLMYGTCNILKWTDKESRY